MKKFLSLLLALLLVMNLAVPMTVQAAEVEEAPAASEEIPAEEVPAEEVPAEEAPAEEVPAEEIPAEEAPAEEAPAEEPVEAETPAAPVETVASASGMHPTELKLTVVEKERSEEESNLLYASAVSLEEAYVQMRNYMMARKSYFTVNVRTTRSYNSNLQGLFDNLYAGACAHTGNPKEGDYLRWNNGGVSAYVSYYSSGGYYYYEFEFTPEYLTTTSQEAEVDRAVANLRSELKLSGKSDYQKVKAIYDWICSNVTYDWDGYYNDNVNIEHSTYSAIIRKTAVCQGYASLFYRMALEEGIDSRLIAGDGGGAHGWNIVELNNKYYNLDPTWDAGVYSYSYFLKCPQTFTGHTRWSEYDTAAFHKEYPMATRDFNPATDDVPTTKVYRVYGSDRYQTAFKAADALKAELGVSKFSNIVVAYGNNFPDALSGTYLAAVKKAPILLVKGSNVAEVNTYIKNNLASGGTVYLLGTKEVVSGNVGSGISGIKVKRLGGADRYETNLLILKEAGVGSKDIIVCTGKNFADSLSASATGLPILLVKDSLNQAQKNFLAGTSGRKVIVGGTSAVKPAVETQLKSYGTVKRLAGANRYETSVMVAKEFFGTPKTAVLAYAQNFPDGLSGGPLAYAIGAPLILTANGKQSNAVSYVTGKGIKSGYVMGGYSLLSDALVRQVFGLGSSTAIPAK